jgi:group I intron endonuclease
MLILFYRNPQPILKYEMDFNYTHEKSSLHISGVYVIKHRTSKKPYVGSSKEIYHRIARHKSDLLRNRHSNQHLQNAINKYGIEEFDVYIAEECCDSDLAVRESYWISKLNSVVDGYNKCDVTDCRKNLVSIETRSKISKTLMGGRSVKMKNIDTLELIKEFPSLYEAAEYILENKLSASKSSSNVRMKISEAIRSKVVSTGGKHTACRQSAYGYKWEAK